MFTYFFAYTYRFVQYQDKGTNRKWLLLGSRKQPTLKLPGPAICYRTKEQLIRCYNYSMTYEGSRASDEWLSDTSESEATLTKGQRASSWPSLRSASRMDPSSSMGSRSGKCDRAVSSADWVPHHTPLAAVTLTHLSTSFAAMARDAANEDDPLASPSIKSSRSTVDICSVSSSTSAWRRSANNALSHPSASSR
jgi:hypothetical protein